MNPLFDLVEDRDRGTDARSGDHDYQESFGSFPSW